MMRTDLPGRSIAERDVVLWCNARAGGAPDPEGLAAKLRGSGRTVRLADLGADGEADPETELVLVAGGDGTVAMAARRLARTGVPLAVLPSGTANNFATAIGLARTGDPGRAVSGMARAIDLGVARGPWGERVFVESLGVGALAAAECALHEAAARGGGYGPEGKLRKGRRALAEALSTPGAFEGAVCVPEGGALPNASLAFVEVCNVGRVGPALPLVPNADPSDGVFDVVLGGLASAETLRRTCAMEDVTAPIEPPFPAHRWPRIELACLLQDLRIDGTFGTEIVHRGAHDERCHDVTVEVLPHALWIVAPQQEGATEGARSRA